MYLALSSYHALTSDSISAVGVQGPGISGGKILIRFNFQSFEKEARLSDFVNYSVRKSAF